MDEKQRQILGRMLKEIDFIQSEYAKAPDDSIENDPLFQRGITMALLNIGELANALDYDFYTAHDQIPWRRIIGLRNAVAHGYFDLDFDVIHSTVANDLPSLKSFLESAI